MPTSPKSSLRPAKRTKLIPFTVDRRTWHRGHGTGSGSLVVGTGKDVSMCCLGHVGLQCDLSQKAMGCSVMPQELPLQKREQWESRTGVDCNHDLIVEMSNVNDDYGLTDHDREAKLKAIAKEIGWKLTFNH